MTPNILLAMVEIFIFGGVTRKSSAMDEAVGQLLGMGLIEHVDGRNFEPTEKGNTWIAMLTDTPIPVVKYVDPRKETA